MPRFSRPLENVWDPKQKLLALKEEKKMENLEKSLFKYLGDVVTRSSTQLSFQSWIRTMFNGRREGFLIGSEVTWSGPFQSSWRP